MTKTKKVILAAVLFAITGGLVYLIKVLRSK